jgi:hypothetical protein
MAGFAIMRADARRWIPPLAALAGSQIFVCLVAWAAGASPFRLESGLKWDALRYLDIAARGYELHKCQPGAIDFPEPPPDAWCGNAGWFPLYPLVMRALHFVGFPYAVAGFVITQIALCAAFVLLWRLLDGVPTEAAVQCLVLAAVIPGSLYAHLVFPLSVALLAVAGSVVALRTRSWVWAGVCALVAAMAYPSAVLLTVVLPLAILLGRRTEGQRRPVLPALAVAVCGIAGLVGVGLLFRLETGRWDAYFLIQRNYGHGLHDPLRVVAGYFTDAAYDIGNGWSLIPAVLIVGTATVVGVRAGRHTGFDAELLTLLGLGIGLLLIPLIVGPRVSAYRSFGLMSPLVLLLVQVPERWRMLLIVVSTVVSGVLAFAYYRDVLI